MELLRFQQCVVLLQTNTITQLLLNKQGLQGQQTVLLTEKDQLSRDLKRVSINGMKSNRNVTDRITGIQTGDLANYVTNLRLQQQQDLSSKVTLLTIARIIEKNSEIARLQQSASHNDLIVSKKAKILAKVIQDVDAVTQEISLIDDCSLVSTFFTNQNLIPAEIADYQVERLYTMFSTGV